MSDLRAQGPHPEGWARRSTTLKRARAHVLQHSAVPSPRFSVGIVALLLSVVSLADLIQAVAETW